MHKEPQGVCPGVAGTVFPLSRDEKIIAGLDGLPAAIDISLPSPLDDKDRIRLFFVGMDGCLGTRRDLNQADTGHIGFLAG